MSFNREYGRRNEGIEAAKLAGRLSDTDVSQDGALGFGGFVDADDCEEASCIAEVTNESPEPDGTAASQVATPVSSFSSRVDLPSVAALEVELKRAKGKRRFRKAFFSVVGVLVVASAIAVLLATRFLPVLQIYGDSMTPTLYEGEIVVAFDYGELEQGDVIAFYYNNKVLVKRVIAGPGDWVDIKDDGAVYVNNLLLNEPYVDEAALGDCNIILPYQVPESHIFVMGDHRAGSIDSRNTAVGCVGEGQIIGKLVIRVWPIDKLGLL